MSISRAMRVIEGRRVVSQNRHRGRKPDPCRDPRGGVAGSGFYRCRPHQRNVELAGLDRANFYPPIWPNKILARTHCREFLTGIGVRQSVHIAISRLTLHRATNAIPLMAMRRWRSTMRELSAEARLHLYARFLSGRTGAGIHMAALYGAFALIAAIVFGTLSVHPF